MFAYIKDFLKYNRFTRAINEALYWIRTHTYNRYHIIDIRDTRGDYYRWGWIDADNAILLANFKILTTFVEKEKPFDVINWDSDPEHQQAGATILELYNWWTRERLANYKYLNNSKNWPAYDKYLNTRKVEITDSAILVFPKRTEQEELEFNNMINYEASLKSKDKEMLHKLIDVMDYLWT